MESTHNDRDHRYRRATAELARVERDLKRLRAEVAVLEDTRTKLLDGQRGSLDGGPIVPLP